MAQAISGAGGLSGLLSNVNPLLGIGSLGLGVFSALGASSAAKKARRANEQRYQQLLNLLRIQGDAEKADIGETFKGERGSIAQNAVGRGLYNSTVLDSLTNQSLGREARAKAAVDQNVAQGMAGAIEGRTDAAPDPGQAWAGLATLLPNAIGLLGPSEEDRYRKLRELSREETAKDYAMMDFGSPAPTARTSRIASTVDGGASMGALRSYLKPRGYNLFSGF